MGRPPEVLVKRVLVFVAPVLQVYSQAVVALTAQFVDVVVAQPEFGVEVAETGPVFAPAAVKAHRTVHPPLDHRPAAT